MFDVRPCRLADIQTVSRLLKASWHATYDAILGERLALRRGRQVYSTVNLAIWIALSRLSSRPMKIRIATRGDRAVGIAMARKEGPGIVLYMLYVDPEQKGQGIGSALLQVVTASYPEATSIRLEVLRDNVAAIAWYKAQGFEVYGETRTASGFRGVAALYMDRTLDRLTQRDCQC
jgi:ribosomal protein S18 acetylase RimI-like enzyme